MFDMAFAIVTQALTFLPLAFGISISYHLLRATDMTIDGSFVLGAGVFARCVTLGLSPLFAAMLALLSGACAGMMVALIQRKGRIEPLLAGVLATFILSSLNLIIMGKPNINLLTQTTLFSAAFAKSDIAGWTVVALASFSLCLMIYLLLQSSLGLHLRAFGNNPTRLKSLGKSIEKYRLLGFGISNLLAAGGGCITAQTIGYADLNMGFGMTLIGIGTIILGEQCFKRLSKKNYFRLGRELIACLLGVLFYFFALTTLLRLDLNPLYLKMILGILLVCFLRMANTHLSVRKMA